MPTAYADSKKNKRIEQPNLSIYGTTVPNSIYDSFSSDSFENGFLSRCLVVEARTEIPDYNDFRTSMAPIQIIRKIEKLSELGGMRRKPFGDDVPDPVLVKYTNKASILLDRFRTLAEEEASKSSKNPMFSIWRRAGEQAQKCALLFACSANQEEPVVDFDECHRATEFVKHCFRHLIFRSHEMVAENDIESRYKRVLRIIKDRGAMTQSALCRATRWLSTRDRTEILNSLLACSDVERRVRSTKGRNVTVYKAL